MRHGILEEKKNFEESLLVPLLFWCRCWARYWARAEQDRQRNQPHRAALRWSTSQAADASTISWKTNQSFLRRKIDLRTETYFSSRFPGTDLEWTRICVNDISAVETFSVPCIVEKTKERKSLFRSADSMSRRMRIGLTKPSSKRSSKKKKKSIGFVYLEDLQRVHRTNIHMESLISKKKEKKIFQKKRRKRYSFYFLLLLTASSCWWRWRGTAGQSCQAHSRCRYSEGIRPEHQQLEP